MNSAPPLAYIYDRCATTNTAMIELRLRACAEYVEEQGWGWGGWWVDKDDAALTNDDRPAFDSLVRSMDASPGTPRVCLVADWGRLSHDTEHRQVFARRIFLAGGWLATVGGESVRSGEVPNGRLNDAPQVSA